MDSTVPLKLCPLCRSESHQIFDQLVSFAVPVRYAICSRCGFVFQPVEKLPEELDEFYSVDYRLIYQGSEAPTAKDRLVQTARADHLVRLLKGSAGAGLQRTLDIGSSAGLFMLKLGEQYHCQAVGIEPGSAYRQQAQEQGLLVYPTLEAMQAVETERFDLISLVHTLEHLPDPLETLRRLRTDWLSPDGWLLLEVPNLYAHDSLELAHLSAFSRHTLCQMVTQAGFSVVKVVEHGVPRSRLLRLYITLLAHPLAASVDIPALQPERGVQLKRRVGLAYRRIVERLLPPLAWQPVRS
jgi:2-polyprenyl-3-methyl-5-hydroxy-6-metoxy-1,4-benzoquinol methylase